MKYSQIGNFPAQSKVSHIEKSSSTTNFLLKLKVSSTEDVGAEAAQIFDYFLVVPAKLPTWRVISGEAADYVWLRVGRGGKALLVIT